MAKKEDDPYKFIREMIDNWDDLNPGYISKDFPSMGMGIGSFKDYIMGLKEHGTYINEDKYQYAIEQLEEHGGMAWVDRKTVDWLCERIFVDRSYVISLDWNKHKQEFATKELEEIHLEPTIISAVDGIKWELSSPHIDRPGAIGCLLSHRLCLQHAVIAGYDRIAIFEDDIIKPPNYREIEKNFFSQLPDDWDMLWLGWDDREKKKVHLSEYVLTPNRPLGTQAIIFRGKEFIKEAFELSKKPEHWDLALEKFCKDYKCYLPYETMFDQRRHLSDIYQDYRRHYATAWYTRVNHDKP